LTQYTVGRGHALKQQVLHDLLSQGAASVFTRLNLKRCWQVCCLTILSLYLSRTPWLLCFSESLGSSKAEKDLPLKECSESGGNFWDRESQNRSPSPTSALEVCCLAVHVAQHRHNHILSSLSLFLSLMCLFICICTRLTSNISPCSSVF